jgi:hypothetical protein
VFFRVSLPLAWRGILAGLLLSFARALGEFGATLMVAGSIAGQTQTLSIAVYEAVQAGQDDTANFLVAGDLAGVHRGAAERRPAGARARGARARMTVWDVLPAPAAAHGRQPLRAGRALLAAAQRLVLFGPSGAGKTQTLRMIAGITRPDAGRGARGRPHAVRQQPRVSRCRRRRGASATCSRTTRCSRT